MEKIIKNSNPECKLELSVDFTIPIVNIKVETEFFDSLFIL